MQLKASEPYAGVYFKWLGRNENVLVFALFKLLLALKLK